MIAYILGVVFLIIGISNEQYLAGVVLAIMCLFIGNVIRSSRADKNNQTYKTYSSSLMSKTQSPTPVSKPPTIPEKSPTPLPPKPINSTPPKTPTPQSARPTVSQTPVAPKRTIYENAKLNEAAVRYLKDERSANYLVHFTPIDNLEGILKSGILPRTQQKEKGVYPDQNRLDGHQDCSSFSISFPNYQMFYKKRCERKYTYVLLRIDAEALNTVPRSDIAYFPHNAASTELKGQFTKYTGLQALKDMFYNSDYRKNLGISSSMTTDPQAEIMIRGKISSEYIKTVYVDNDFAYQKAKGICSRYPNIEVKNDDYLFRPRSDWRNWRTYSNY